MPQDYSVEDIVNEKLVEGVPEPVPVNADPVRINFEALDSSHSGETAPAASGEGRWWFKPSTKELYLYVVDHFELFGKFNVSTGALEPGNWAAPVADVPSLPSASEYGGKMIFVQDDGDGKGAQYHSNSTAWVKIADVDWAPYTGSQIKSLYEGESDTNAFTDDEKSKLAGIEDSAVSYIHPTGDGNLHVPANSLVNGGKVLVAGSSPGSLSWEVREIADGTTLEDITGSLLAITGLSDDMLTHASTWNDAGFDIANYTMGARADDALGSIINSANSGSDYVGLSFNGVSIPIGDYYMTSSVSSYSGSDPVISHDQGDSTASYVGPIVTPLGTEYVWKFTVPAGVTNASGFNGGTNSSSYHVRFWNGNPTIVNSRKIKEVTEDLLSSSVQVKLNSSSEARPSAMGKSGIPGSNNDINDSVNASNGIGFLIGSIWQDISVSPSEFYRCEDNADGAAFWIKTTLTVDELGALALLDTVSSTRIEASAITASKIADSAVTTTKIADSSVIASKLGAITGLLLAKDGDGKVRYSEPELTIVSSFPKTLAVDGTELDVVAKSPSSSSVVVNLPASSDADFVFHKLKLNIVRDGDGNVVLTRAGSDNIFYDGNLVTSVTLDYNGKGYTMKCSGQGGSKTWYLL